ncbi:MAG TPA: hypothetical protein PKB11_06790 [Desulfovibrio sp.]|uniref:hypothetical protein n=1 Tax=Desulfovibrio sp. TaxID=885 RepID=UPI002C762B24|nr:hypothetical protein [Desulfovibrio sp.]HMM38450.1 hypothetical protein [Desulfovibrio sp.]
MDANKDNILHMDGYRRSESAPAGETSRTGRDFGKLALVLALLSLVLVVIFFFGLSSNLKGISEEMRQVANLKTELAAVQAQMALVQSQPTEGSRKLLVSAMIEDMAQKAAFLGGMIQNEEQARRMAQVQESLRQIQLELAH